ncbi:zinc-binding dehydrogenase [Streptomyces sp. NBC_01618]|uniref:zinc-binding dehydrogenase n=1 Tax=Streptomyces sp. NBC_01618 TaxID=2975900 RepID=UPI003864223A|nr:zinc-binding dehydrogenase [Streptomyces sp. NBC_01618]
MTVPYRSDVAQIAAIATYGEAPVVETVPLPSPEAGAIVVKMDVATVCGTDVHQWQGAYAAAFGLQPPICMGHEGVGVILERGKGVETDSASTPLTEGDRVIWTHQACGQCHECSVLGAEVLCTNRTMGMHQSIHTFPHVSATFGTHSYVWPRAGRLRVPDGVKSEWASAASCALRTVKSALEKIPTLGTHDTVVIQGAGPLGLFATAAVSVHRPRKLIVVGAPDSSLELARQWGATDTISIGDLPDAESRKAAIQGLTDGRGPNVTLEFAGVPSAFAEALDFTARGGHVVLVGSAANAPHPTSAHHIVTKQLSVSGCYSATIGHYAQALDFIDRFQGEFDWDQMLGNRYRLDQLGDALSRMRSGTEAKPIIVPEVGPSY